MARLKELADKRSDKWHFDPRRLRPEQGFNQRNFGLQDTQDHIRSLKLKIAHNGFDESKPIKCRLGDDDTPLIRDGECRWRAVMELIAEGHQISLVPVTVSTGNNLDDAIEQYNSNDSLKLDAFAESRLFRRILSLNGDNLDALADRIGRPVSYINERLVIGQASEEVQDLARAGAVPITAVSEIVRMPAAKRKAVVEVARERKAKGQKLSLREAQQARHGHAKFIAFGQVKKLHDSLKRRQAKKPKDTALKHRIEGVELVLDLARGK